MADLWLPERLRTVTDLVRLEGGLFRSLLDFLNRWATRLRTAVFGSNSAPNAPADPIGVFQTAQWFATEVRNVVDVEIREIYDWAAGDDADPEPDAVQRTRDYLTEATNRLARIPDSVYGQVRAQTMKGVTEGWSMDELAGRIDEILAESGSERWRNRAMTIARTETIGAYNGGKWSQFRSIANQVGGVWEKGWLATDDERTRPTHVEADLQRVPLLQPFKVGDSFGMYPGHAVLPPSEVINCRCTMILLAEGETMNYSYRQFRKART